MSSTEESSKIKAEMLFVIGKYESLVTLVRKSPYASKERSNNNGLWDTLNN